MMSHLFSSHLFPIFQGQRRTAQQAYYQEARVFNGAPPGTSIIEIDATTLQSGPTASAALAAADIRIKLAGRDKKHFALVQHVLQASRRLERPIGRTYNVSIEARSKKQRGVVYAALYITIYIIKKNEAAPIFLQDSFDAEVYRYAEISSDVIRVLAEDKDAETMSGPMDTGVDFSLVTGRGSNYFSIGKKSGIIKTRASLTELKEVVYLQVIAADRGLPPMSVTSGVTVIIRDISGRYIYISVCVCRCIYI